MGPPLSSSEQGRSTLPGRLLPINGRSGPLRARTRDPIAVARASIAPCAPRPWGSRFGDVTWARIAPGGIARIECRRISSRRARMAQAGPGARRSVSRRPTPFRSRPRTSCPGPRRPAGAAPVIPGRVPRCGDPPAAGRRHPLRRPPAVRGTATRQARGGGAVPDRVRSSGAGGRGPRILISSEHPGRPASPMRPIGAGARGARSIYRRVGCPNLLQRPRPGRSVGRESLIFRASSRGRSRRGTSLWQIWTRPRPGPSQEPHTHHPAPAHPRRRNDAGPTDRRAQ